MRSFDKIRNAFSTSLGFFGIILLFVLCFGFAIPSAAGDVIYTLDVPGISISIPDGFTAITRNTKETDPACRTLKTYGLTIDDVVAFMKEKNAYLDAFDKNVEYEIVVTSETRDDFPDFNSLSDKRLTSLKSDFSPIFEDAGVKMNSYEIYQHLQKKFIKIEFRRTVEEDTTYGIMYFTVHGNTMVSVALHSYLGTVPASKDAMLKKVIDSVSFTKKATQASTFTPKNTSSAIPSFVVPILSTVLLSALLILLSWFLRRNDQNLNRTPFIKKKKKAVNRFSYQYPPSDSGYSRKQAADEPPNVDKSFGNQNNEFNAQRREEPKNQPQESVNQDIPKHLERLEKFRNALYRWLDLSETTLFTGVAAQQLALSRLAGDLKFRKLENSIFVETKRTDEEAENDRSGYRDYLVFSGNHAGVSYPHVKCKRLMNSKKVYYLPFDPEYNNIVMKQELGDTYTDQISEAEQLGYSPAIDLARNRANDER